MHLGDALLLPALHLVAVEPVVVGMPAAVEQQRGRRLDALGALRRALLQEAPAAAQSRCRVPPGSAAISGSSGGANGGLGRRTKPRISSPGFDRAQVRGGDALVEAAARPGRRRHRADRQIDGVGRGQRRGRDRVEARPDGARSSPAGPSSVSSIAGIAHQQVVDGDALVGDVARERLLGLLVLGR